MSAIGGKFSARALLLIRAVHGLATATATATATEIRIARFAGVDQLQVDLRQRLCLRSSPKPGQQMRSRCRKRAKPEAGRRAPRQERKTPILMCVQRYRESAPKFTSAHIFIRWVHFARYCCPPIQLSNNIQLYDRRPPTAPTATATTEKVEFT